MNKTTFAVSIVFLLIQLISAPLVEAKLYTWVDRTGKTRRTYYPPPANQVMQVQDEPEYQDEQASNEVELYVTSWCPYCKQAIKYFKERGISITVYDIEKDPEAAARKKEMDTSGGGVPFAVINGYYVSGYSPAYYKRLLNN